MSRDIIRSREDLRSFLMADSRNYKTVISMNPFKRMLFVFRSNPISDQHMIWKYIYHLRYCEYYHNRLSSKIKRPFFLLIKLYHLYQLRTISYKTGFQIPLNVVGRGLTIWHYGSIIINDRCIIGSHCTLYPGVLIGQKSKNGPAPIVGDNCFIASGAKIIGNVKIGNNCIIAQNAVVISDIPDNAVAGGVPAKVIKTMVGV